ncbi:MAG: hypothetical protein QXH08_00005, partial [Candidatus Hadarchaeales archaeon]
TLLANMFLSEVERGRGAAYLDPQGDVFRELAAHCRGREEDVIIFDPADREWPVGLNILEAEEHVDPDLVCAQIIGIFQLLFGKTWGPRMENILRNTVLVLLDNPGSTLVDIPRVLIDRPRRLEMLRNVRNPQLFFFWLKEADSLSPAEWHKAIQPVLNKVGRFVSNPLVRNIVGQKRSGLNFREILDGRKILLANLSKGQIGAENTFLLGAILVAKLWLAALSRYDLREAEREPYFLYVDEFQDFAFTGFLEMFSQARKYGLALTVANQFLAQLDEGVRQAIFGNVGTIVSFTIGVSDARILAQEFAPYLEPLDFVNLPNHHIYLRLCVDGTTSRPFSARSFPPLRPSLPPDEEEERVGHIRDRCRSRYAVPRREVEAALYGDEALGDFQRRFLSGEFGETEDDGIGEDVIALEGGEGG